MNRLDALRCFCIAAETLHFSETAARLSVSPQVVTRTIADLEATLGNRLFLRDTRNVRLSSFGAGFLPKARLLLADADALFADGHAGASNLAGIVRIALPNLPDHDAILADLLAALQDYPALHVEWRVDNTPQNWVAEQTDIGIRASQAPDPRLIVRRIRRFREIIVAAPALIERLGTPHDLDDLLQRYPASTGIHHNGRRVSAWHVDGRFIQPKHIEFVSNQPNAELQAALAGRCCALVVDYLALPYLNDGRLLHLLPGCRTDEWQLYLYRPYQSLTPARVRLVYDILAGILTKRYGER